MQPADGIARTIAAHPPVDRYCCEREKEERKKEVKERRWLPCSSSEENPAARKKEQITINCSSERASRFGWRERATKNEPREKPFDVNWNGLTERGKLIDTASGFLGDESP